MDDRSSDELVREAKTWLTPEDGSAPPLESSPVSPVAPRSAYPSDRITAEGTSNAPPSAPAPQSGGDARPPPPSRSTAGITFGLVVAVIGLMVAGVFVVRSITAAETVDIFAVQPGDCFADPVGASVSEIDVIDCTQAHDLEAFAMVTLPFGADTTLPDDETLFATAWDECLAFFQPYTGEPYDTSEWYLDAFVPDRHSWKSGDRDALCVVFLADADGLPATATRSARA